MPECVHKNFRCYVGWSEKPIGTGEATVVIIPIENGTLTEEQLKKLMKPLNVTTFSEETIDFTIQDLDNTR